MKKILFVFGTRPEAIKMAPVIKELGKHPEKFKNVVCVTAQHREMLDQVLELFEIKPDYDLNIMKPGQDLFDVTSNVLLGLREIITKEQPDIVLVHGDTTTSMAASLASFYCQTPVGHIEAGLRSHNKHAPFPEEINRKVTGAIADIHFAPTPKAKQNLLNEGVPAKNIFITGNTVIDSLLLAKEKLESGNLKKEITAQLSKKFPSLNSVFSASNKRIILVTGHRRENFGDGFKGICQALNKITQDFLDVEIIYPVHLNPNVVKPVAKYLGDNPRIHLIEPLEYLPFLLLMDLAYIIITDSGGVQEEAPSLGKPVLVMRETSERPEAIEAGTVQLVGTDPNKIYNETANLLSDYATYQKMSFAHNPYGDGKAAENIAKILADDGPASALNTSSTRT